MCERKDRVRGWETQGWATCMLNQQDFRFGAITCSSTRLSTTIPGIVSLNSYLSWGNGLQILCSGVRVYSQFVLVLEWYSECHFECFHRFHSLGVRGDNQARDEHRSSKLLGQPFKVKVFVHEAPLIFRTWLKRGMTWSSRLYLITTSSCIVRTKY